jgi:hypothetical protein
MFYPHAFPQSTHLDAIDAVEHFGLGIHGLHLSAKQRRWRDVMTPLVGVTERRFTISLPPDAVSSEYKLYHYFY